MSIYSFIIDLEDYHIKQKIGSGGFGEVFIIENKNTNELSACKVSKNEVITAKDQRNFFSEIEILMKVHHPTILSLSGFNLRNFEDQPFPVIITEYLESGSLSKVLEATSKGLAPNEWTFTKKFINILGIALGMQHLHSQGIIHRDLKPDNILLDSNFYPRICDFGLSKIFSNEETRKDSESLEFTKTTVAGTILYMAPEIVDGEKYSMKIDVYSYSLIVYEILSGNPPTIPGNNPFQIMFNVKAGNRPNLSNITNETQRSFLEHCWCNDPKSRYSFSEIVSFLLSSFQNKTDNSFIDEDIDESEIEFYLQEFGNLPIQESTKIEEIEEIKEPSETSFAETDKLKEHLVTHSNLENKNELFYIDPNGNRHSIDLTNSSSIFKYANMLYNGEGIERNSSEAIKYFKMAADQGHSDSMLYYAFMLYNGEGIERNYSEAIKYFKMAIDLGNSYAMNNYANMLKNGIGIERNYSEAIKYYKMGIDKGDSGAMNGYANMLYNGEGIEQNYSEALKYYKMAADHGDSDAMYNYALMLYSGKGTERNYSEAIKYYKMAADHGDSSAMFNYAFMLYNGEGTERNSSEAIKYYKMAANQGHSSAMYNYAFMLYNGEGIERNCSEAIKYFKMAADRGDSNALKQYHKLISSSV